MNNQITIEQVSNGFVVILPEPKPGDSGLFAQSLPDGSASIGLEQIQKMARDVAAGMQMDPLLASLQQANETPAPKGLKDLKTENIHIFKTFAEVLDFLKYKIEE